MSPSYTRIKRTMSDEQLVADYEQCRDSLAVACRGGVCSATVLAAVRKAGKGHLIPPRGSATLNRHRALSISDEAIVARYLDGQSGTQIAQAIGCDAGMVYRILARAGVPRRASVADRAIEARQAAARKRRERHGDG
jgi:hypothetical protein